MFSFFEYVSISQQLNSLLMTIEISSFLTLVEYSSIKRSKVRRAILDVKIIHIFFAIFDIFVWFSEIKFDSIVFDDLKKLIATNVKRKKSRTFRMSITTMITLTISSTSRTTNRVSRAFRIARDRLDVQKQRWRRFFVESESETEKKKRDEITKTNDATKNSTITKKKWNEIRENVNFSSIQSFDDREFQNSFIEHFIKQTSRILFFKKRFDKTEKVALMILMSRKISTILFLNKLFFERHFVDDEIWNVWLIRRAKKSLLCLSNCSNSSNKVKQIISFYSFLQIVAIMRDCLFSFSRVYRKIHRVMTLWLFCRSRANEHANQNKHLSRNLRRKRTSRKRQFFFFAINCDEHARIDHRFHASHVDMSNSLSFQSFTFVSSFSSWTIFC